MSEVRRGELAGRRVLVVEDEFFLAEDLRRALVEQGAEVVGPAGTLDRARSLARDPVDLAVLDVNLRGELIFAFADELRARGVPFVFTTGYDAEMVPAQYQDVERWEKPFHPHQLVQALANLRPDAVAG